jgi:hypothetical protein
VLDALRTLREEQVACGEGNCCTTNELIFVTESGMPLRQKVVKRHTAATLGIAAGVSVKVISDQLGYASISFTLERYSHVLPSIQDEAAAKIEKLLAA